MRIQIKNLQKAIILQLLQGRERKDLNVQASGNTVASRLIPSKQIQTQGVFHSEFRYGSVELSKSQYSTNLKDSILTLVKLNLSETETLQPAKLPVNSPNRWGIYSSSYCGRSGSGDMQTALSQVR
ncbi:MAG: hypothetical protein N3E45_08345 [Oscillatoriaceae bacterium SKW80]|nr:hypothetical protein [Oscillatoriaceae bacterium SKYG93]MCX8120829.1 hypothetical protein [Oscillatoriaceae bacterium SKW80]MDW8454170.1 hypothetical protein [Oscillatoriaceae cyanobacterium SKYGB_i_bin93]HIK26505.1 hypothetical protein [Oscillatoriaceae cyanobacterium M7585_C2015_266]